MRFAALPTAPRMARVLVEQATQAWKLKEDCAETAKLLVSELVTNAVKQTGRVGGPPTPRPTEHVAIIQVRVVLHDEVLRIEVWDNATAAPEMQAQADGAENGRGLFLVSQLSQRWGHYFPQAGGKVVWADIPLASSPNASATNGAAAPWPLPKRKGSVVLRTANAGLRPDVALLERVLWGLQRLGQRPT